MISENDYIHPPEDEDGGELHDKEVHWNVFYKRIRLALGIEKHEVAAVFENTPGPLITANIVHRWGLGCHQAKYQPMSLLDFDRFTNGLPSYITRKKLADSRAQEERRKAEEVSARRREASRKRIETMARKREEEQAAEKAKTEEF